MQVVTYFYKLVPNQILPNKIYEMHEYDMQTNIKIQLIIGLSVSNNDPPIN